MGRYSFTSSLLSVAREIERGQRNTAKRFERDRKRFERELIAQQKEDSINYAKQKTEEAEQERFEIQNILQQIVKNTVTWNDYLDHNEFDKPKPIPKAEHPLSETTIIKQTEFLIIKIIKLLLLSYRQNKMILTKRQYSRFLEKWNMNLEEIKRNNRNLQIEYLNKLKEWEEEKNRFYEEQKTRNEELKTYSKTYSEKNKNAVEFYVNEILAKSQYPDFFISDWELEYDIDSGIIIIDYALPLKKYINCVKQVKYVMTRKEFTETSIKESEIDKIYDNVLYQLSLRVTHEIYITDKANAIKSVVFNGWITHINRSTGKDETICILSLLSKKDEFLEVDLSRVDAKFCFRKFKGRSGAKLNELVAVAPIAELNKEDKRFVDSYSIGEKINGINIAAMHWKDFENLIRELFEKEFCKDSAEIKITQASRDGGVDAIMFDPDPIRGGKIVIQAKRYTNVVGVSAVRDLYGTVVNEGALKGILITTANYGSDSYEFSKDKPLTLLDGSNLLHLLEKNGYKAFIDLVEAKKILNA